MIKYCLLLFALFAGNIYGQRKEPQLRPEINRDSLIKTLIQEFSAEEQSELLNATDGTIDFILFMGTMPTSSKKELIDNYTAHEPEINRLQDHFKELIPTGLNVDFEIDPPHKYFDIPERISLKIFKTGDKENSRDRIIFHSDSYNDVPDSLETGYKILGWNESTLTKIRQLLSDANCISISTGNELATIGFSYSGLGKYAYKLFDQLLSEEQQQKYNDGCFYIYYKDNVVLEYGGGAIGRQCFEEDE